MKNFIVFICTAFFTLAPAASITAGPPSHEPYSELLGKYVDKEGMVNYQGFIREQEKFDRYLNALSNNPPEASWTRSEKMAYWINAYNAFTIKLIMNHYPVESIKDIGPAIQIPFVNTPWQKEFIRIGNDMTNLDGIEHDVLRDKFGDPRIHFALVCASMSCPKLRDEAYTAEKLNEQLNEQGRHFLANKRKNIITPNALKLSKYFSWYKGDFTEHSSLIEYLNRYTEVKINEDADIDYLDYNWNLNEQ